MALALLFVAYWICLVTTAARATSISLSKPGCPDRCGNVTIPYPFGIGPNCSANSSFAVTCQNSTNAFLSGINNMEVLNITLSGAVTIKQRLSPMNCSSELRTQSWGESLLGTPFSISAEYNSFVNLGCQNSVWLRPNRSALLGGCMAICDANSTEASCNGVNCCQTTLSQPLKELQFTYQSVQSTSNTSFCGYAFLAENNWFTEDYRTYRGLHNHDVLSPLDTDYAHIVLEWDIDVDEQSPYTTCFYPNRNRNSQYPYPYRVEYGSWTRQCRCRYGFEGNPYILTGCRDIDECRDLPARYCFSGTCINTEGSYHCQYPDNNSQVRTAFIGVGSGLGALLLLYGSWRAAKLVRRKIKTNRKRKFFKRNGGLLLEQELSSTNKGLEKIKLFTSKELAQATDHYNENRILGLGGQGTVYKGMLPDGRIVAVKKSKRVDESDLEVFINEVVILSQINHRNVVKLLGCCLETDVPLLVYEFIPNGTLFQHIHDKNEELPLLWEMRVRIATEVARALSYLHSAASSPIFHRDIKSTNILLDDKYRAKVADFGTSRSVSLEQTHLTTRVLGTFGYLDPEYFQSSQFTEKSDVYSFGVVMVELLTGEKAISVIRAETGRSLATHFLYSMEENRLFDILDERVLKEGRKVEIEAVARIAQRCLNLNGKRRPTMKEVAVELEGIQMLKEGSSFQIKQQDVEFHTIELYEAYEFSSISESMRFDSITSDASDVNPLLVDEP